MKTTQDVENGSPIDLNLDLFTCSDLRRHTYAFSKKGKRAGREIKGVTSGWRGKWAFVKKKKKKVSFNVAVLF